MFSRNVRQPKTEKVTEAQKEENFAKWAVKKQYAHSLGQGKVYYQQFFARKKNMKKALERFFKHKKIKTKVKDQFVDYFIDVLEGGTDY